MLLVIVDIFIEYQRLIFYQLENMAVSLLAVVFFMLLGFKSSKTCEAIF